jgi:hypothetical protein
MFPHVYDDFGSPLVLQSVVFDNHKYLLLKSDVNCCMSSHDPKQDFSVIIACYLMPALKSLLMPSQGEISLHATPYFHAVPYLSKVDCCHSLKLWEIV